MGLIKATMNAASTAIGDQFKEFIECPQIANDVIIQRGVVSHGVGNKNYSEGIISNGSAIDIPAGMAMMIIDNGKVAEFSAEPGTFTWDTSSEPSIFTGGLGKGIIDTIKTIGSRITFGGQTAKDQRVYYVNIKMIPGLTFGSTQPETVFDPIYGSVEITYNGEYAIRVDDPVILVTNIVGANPKDTLTFDEIFVSEGRNMLKGRFAQKVSEAISNIMTIHNVSFNRIQSYKSDVTDQMNQILDADWHQKYGIIVEDVALRINATEESRKIIQDVDAEVTKTTRMGQVYSNNMAGTMAAATAEAMKNASKNDSGAMMGFMGMNMAQTAGTNVMGAVAGMPQNPQAPVDAPTQPEPGSLFKTEEPAPVAEETPVEVEAPAEDEAAATPSAFCPNCGAKNEGSNFCANCGQKLV